VKEKLEEDSKKGLWYKSGMAGQHTRETGQNKEGIVDKVVIPHCFHCQSDIPHQHKTSNYARIIG
jgi:hypothetical protein